MRRALSLCVVWLAVVTAGGLSADVVLEQANQILFQSDDPAGCDVAIRSGALKTCANLPLNGSWSGNPGDLILAAGPSGVPARLRTILPTGQNVPMLHTSRDGVTNLGQPAVWLLQPNASIVLDPQTAGLITLGTSGSTALFMVHCGDGLIQVLATDLRGIFGVGRGSAPLSFYYEPHQAVRTCVVTNTSPEPRRVGVNSVGSG